MTKNGENSTIYILRNAKIYYQLKMTRLTDFDCLLSYFKGSEFVTVEDDGVNRYQLPQTEGLYESF